jgi:hypothetical protein
MYVQTAVQTRYEHDPVVLQAPPRLGSSLSYRQIFSVALQERYRQVHVAESSKYFKMLSVP